MSVVWTKQPKMLKLWTWSRIRNRKLIVSDGGFKLMMVLMLQDVRESVSVDVKRELSCRNKRLIEGRRACCIQSKTVVSRESDEIPSRLPTMCCLGLMGSSGASQSWLLNSALEVVLVPAHQLYCYCAVKALEGGDHVISRVFVFLVVTKVTPSTSRKSSIGQTDVHKLPLDSLCRTKRLSMHYPVCV